MRFDDDTRTDEPNEPRQSNVSVARVIPNVRLTFLLRWLLNQPVGNLTNVMLRSEAIELIREVLERRSHDGSEMEG